MNPLALLVLLWLPLWTMEVWAHSWYPLNCCGGGDCFPLGDREVEETTAGWTVKVTGEFIPRAKGQVSQDGAYHICRNTSNWQVRCFFYPNRGV